MSIEQTTRIIKNIPLPVEALAESGETVTYGKDGHIERFTLFRKLFLSMAIILIASLSFGLGRLSMTGKSSAVKIEYAETIVGNETVTNTATAINSISNSPVQTVGESTVVSSKNGTKYHYLHCPGAKQIKEENKIMFASPSAAESAGYTLAANCKPK